MLVACGSHDDGLDLPDDICEGQTCSMHGTCVDTGSAPTCECDAGFHAESLTCVEDGMTGACNGVTCSDHGVCSDASGDVACICETGYHAEQLSCIEDGTMGPCANVDCGDGVCVDSGGSATCQCDAGFHADGLTCKPDCSAWPGTLDVPRVMLSGTVTVAGGPLAYGAVLRFVETTTADTFTVYVGANGQIADSGAPIPVAPGNYRVYYSKRGGGGFTSEPWNTNRLLTTVNLATSQQLVLDVPRVMVSGTVTVAGGALAYGAVLTFVDTTTDDTFTVYVGANGQIADSGAPIPVAPGNYRVYYAKRGGGGFASEPWNTQRLLTTVNLTTSQQLALDVPRIMLGGTVTIAGGPLAYGAVLRFVETTSEDTFSVYVGANGQIADSGAPIPVAPGNYHVYYSKRGGGGFASEPWNTNRLLTTVNLTTSQQLALDVPRVMVSGTVTIDGGSLAYGAVLRFVDTTSDDTFSVYVGANGQIADSGAPIPIAPGNYRVYYSKRGGGGFASEPWNTNRLLTTVNLASSQQLALDVPRTSLTGTVTVAGGPLAYGAVLRFEDATSDDAFTVYVGANGQIADSGAPIPIVPGSYRTTYSKRGGGGFATEPWNTARPLGCFVLP